MTKTWRDQMTPEEHRADLAKRKAEEAEREKVALAHAAAHPVTAEERANLPTEVTR